jgi:hypothetical protein
LEPWFTIFTLISGGIPKGAEGVKLIKNFFNDESGATAAGHGLTMASIAVIIITAISLRWWP